MIFFEMTVSRPLRALTAACFVVSSARLAAAQELPPVAPNGPWTAPAPALQPPPPVAVAPPGPAMPPAYYPPTLLTFRTPSPANLERRVPGIYGEPRWEIICRASCTLAVDPLLSYRVTGDDVVDSYAFLMTGPTMTVDAHPASKTTRTLAVIGTVGGGGIALLGLELLAIGAGGTATTEHDGRVSRPLSASESAGFRSVGWALLGTGVVVGAVSLAFALANWSTKVTVDERAPALRPIGWLGPNGIEF